MTTTVIGATGRTGTVVVQRLLAEDRPVRVLVRDPTKARRLFGEVPGLQVVQVPLDDPARLRSALAGSETVFTAMGSVGLEGNLQRLAIQAAADTADLRQFVRLSVLNTGPDSLGLNQRGHWDIDFAAQAAGIAYTTVRPTIFSASLLLAAPEIKATRTWTGVADTGRIALIDHRDAADVIVRVLTDSSTWGRHHELTGPRQVTWPEALQALSAELGEEVVFRTTDAFALIQRLTTSGIPASQAELLATREWAILAGENERSTTGVQDLLGREPRTIEEFLHENRDLFR
jgi:NAD(P)H dehydrogenase (quinone)